MYRSGIEDLGIQLHFDYAYNSKHRFKFGFSYIKHHFFPGYMNWERDDPEYNSYIDTTITFANTLRPDNAFIYFEDTYNINKNYQLI